MFTNDMSGYRMFSALLVDDSHQKMTSFNTNHGISALNSTALEDISMSILVKSISEVRISVIRLINILFNLSLSDAPWFGIKTCPVAPCSKPLVYLQLPRGSYAPVCFI